MGIEERKVFHQHRPVSREQSVQRSINEAVELLHRSEFKGSHVGEYISGLLEKGKQKPFLLDTTLELLKFADKQDIRTLNEERMNAPRVNIMETVNQYSAEEMRHITGRTKAIQLTHECTVGCPWCGAMAKRRKGKEGLSGALSLESIDEYSSRFSEDFNNDKVHFMLFRSSDPFDWMDDKGHTYLDVYKTFVHNTHVVPLTSTSVPKGTEFAILEFLNELYSLYKSNDAEKNEALKSSFKFSRTIHNFERIDMIMDILRISGVNKSFIDNVISIRDKDVIDTEDGPVLNYDMHILKAGYSKHKKDIAYHDERDLFGIFAEEGVFYTPDKGFVSSVNTCVTDQNPRGVQERVLISGKLELPQIDTMYNYMSTYPVDSMVEHFFLLVPNIKYDLFTYGQSGGTKEVLSVGRDVLAFAALTQQLDILQTLMTNGVMHMYFIHPSEAIPKINRQIRESLQPEFIKRKEQCLKLCETEPDQEAVEIARRLIAEVEELFGKLVIS